MAMQRSDYMNCIENIKEELQLFLKNDNERMMKLLDEIYLEEIS